MIVIRISKCALCPLTKRTTGRIYVIVRKGEVTRARILDRAFRLAGRHGVEGVTLSTLAADLGLSKSGLFAHFASKEELSVAVLRETTERFVTHVVRPALAAPRGAPRIRQIFENWIAWLND